MFGFFKEMAGAFKDGLDEGRAELAEGKAAQDEQARRERETQVAAATPAERFAVGLGAVYRETFLQELKAAAEQQRPASYLFVAGLPPIEVSAMTKLLRRDFDARDSESVVYAAGALAQQVGRDPDIDALLIARGCWLATAATGVGLLDPHRLLELTQPFGLQAGRVYTSWADFGQRFLAGERHAPGSNPLGRRALAKTVESLLATPGSPWHDQPWPGRPAPSA